MHLVVIVSTANIGGAEISLIELIRRLPRETRVSVILPRDGEFRGYCEQAGVGVHIVQWPKTLAEVNEASVSSLFRVSPVLDVLKTVRALRECLRGINADVVITNGLKAHLMGAAACRSKYPLLWYLREGLDRRTNSGFLFRMLSKYCSGAIAISDYVKDSWSKVIGKKPVTVIYNIVDTTAFNDAADPADLVKRPGEIWFSVIGALTPIKGHDLFIEAAS